MNLGQAALDLAGAGFAVFPLRPGDKRPLFKGGFHGATTDSEAIFLAWQQWPHANIGLRTGAGLGVVDVDLRNGGRIPRWAMELKTRIARTPGGWHIYLRLPERHWSSRPIGEGIDLKADGGYVVAPPSVREDGARYEWLSRDPLASADPAWLEPAAGPSIGRGALPDHMPAGTRNHGLCRWAGFFRAQGQDLHELNANLQDVNRLYCDPVCDEADVLKIAAWAASKPS